LGEEEKQETAAGDEKSWFASRFGNLFVRVASAIVLVAIIVALLWWGDIPFTVGITLIVVGGLWELYSTFSRHGYKPAIIISVAAAAAFPILAYFIKGREGQELTWFATALALYMPILFAACIFRGGCKSPTSNIAISLLGAVLVGFGLSHFVLMLGLDSISWTAPLTIIVMVWISDAVAYLGGSAFGRHKMAPNISPGKTWEGTLISTAGVFIAAYILKITINRAWLSMGVAMELAAIVVILAPLGDLSESMVKRELGIKDMSSLIPGHGGIMDRFDSMFFTAAVSYYFLRFFIFKI
jgi:phosphatidate cytidylyltransferase